MLVAMPAITKPVDPDGLDPALRQLAPRIASRAETLDEDGAFPRDDFADLAAIGALAMPFEQQRPDVLLNTLRIVGHASLPLGRLLEGHVNAAVLISRYGTASQQAAALRHARAGEVFGVWNTEGQDGLRLVPAADGFVLEGRKTFASGAGFLMHPLVTARTDNGAAMMVLPRLDHRRRADLSQWRAHGMRASATGSFDFTGLAVRAQDIIGADGDYHRQPVFSAGAWRFLAVQLGGVERLVDEACRHLRETGRAADPHQVARIGQAATAAESDPQRTVAYVNLARGAVERCALDVLELVHRSIGLAAFLRSHAVERISRDLATYLRQPAPGRALSEGGSYVLGCDSAAGDLWR